MCGASILSLAVDPVVEVRRGRPQPPQRTRMYCGALTPGLVENTRAAHPLALTPHPSSRDLELHPPTNCNQHPTLGSQRGSSRGDEETRIIAVFRSSAWPLCTARSRHARPYQYQSFLQPLIGSSGTHPWVASCRTMFTCFRMHTLNAPFVHICPHFCP